MRRRSTVSVEVKAHGPDLPFESITEPERLSGFMLVAPAPFPQSAPSTLSPDGGPDRAGAGPSREACSYGDYASP